MRIFQPKSLILGGLAVSFLVCATPVQAQELRLRFPWAGGGALRLPISGVSRPTSWPILGSAGGMSWPLPGQVGGGSVSLPGGGGGAWPEHRQVDASQAVPQYEVIQYGGRSAAVPRASLPLRVYSADPSYGATTSRAITVWNDVGRSLYGLSFFERVTVPEAAQINIDWSGQGVPQGAVGATSMRMSSENIQVTGVSVRGGDSASPTWQAEVLAHELGHVLGLDHSQQPSDLMYLRKRSEAPRGEVTLSPRDLHMLRWLYAQNNTVPMVAARR